MRRAGTAGAVPRTGHTAMVPAGAVTAVSLRTTPAAMRRAGEVSAASPHAPRRAGKPAATEITAAASPLARTAPIGGPGRWPEIAAVARTGASRRTATAIIRRPGTAGVPRSAAPFGPHPADHRVG